MVNLITKPKDFKSAHCGEVLVFRPESVWGEAYGDCYDTGILIDSSSTTEQKSYLRRDLVLAAVNVISSNAMRRIRAVGTKYLWGDFVPSEINARIIEQGDKDPISGRPYLIPEGRTLVRLSTPVPENKVCVRYFAKHLEEELKKRLS